MVRLVVFFQVIAVLAVICSAVVAILKFDNNFHYTHERLGLALWILVWIAPLLGFIRPDQYVFLLNSNYGRSILVSYQNIPLTIYILCSRLTTRIVASSLPIPSSSLWKLLLWRLHVFLHHRNMFFIMYFLAVPSLLNIFHALVVGFAAEWDPGQPGLQPTGLREPVECCWDSTTSTPACTRTRWWVGRACGRSTFSSPFSSVSWCSCTSPRIGGSTWRTKANSPRRSRPCTMSRSKGTKASRLEVTMLTFRSSRQRESQEPRLYIAAKF